MRALRNEPAIGISHCCTYHIDINIFRFLFFFVLLCFHPVARKGKAPKEWKTIITERILFLENEHLNLRIKKFKEIATMFNKSETFSKRQKLDQ